MDITRDEDAHMRFATEMCRLHEQRNFIGNIENALAQYHDICKITKCAGPGCNKVNIYLGRDTFVSSDISEHGIMKKFMECGYCGDALCSEHANFTGDKCCVCCQDV